MRYENEASSGGHGTKNVLAILNTLGFAHALCTRLEKAGYRVFSADDMVTALNLVRSKQPDLVMVELALVANPIGLACLPERGSDNTEGTARALDGLGVWRRIRRASAAPVLVLTANLHEAEWFVEQESCADDFALIPSGPGQVLARIQALLRWAENRKALQSNVIRAGDLEVQPAYHQVTIAGQPVDMTRTELALLTALASEPGRAFSRSELMGALKGKRSLSRRTIDSHINNLRSKIEVDPRHPRRVLTVFGVGYRLSDCVNE